MSGVEQLQYLSWLLFLVVFVLVLVRTVRRPTPAHIDMTLFFGVVAIVIVSTTLTSKVRLNLAWVTDVVTPIAAIALGYLLLRLVHDFTDVPTLLMRAVKVGMLASIVAVVVLPAPVSTGIALGLVGYLALVITYDTWAFARQATRTRGVTRRRMQAAAAGSLCLVLELIVNGLAIVMPAIGPALNEVGAALGLGSGICYFVGFAPPTWLRRAWQEPELRALLVRATSLARLPDLRDVVHELERGAADAIGAPAARIALWDADTGRLQVFMDGDAVPLPQLPRAWRQQRAMLVTDVTTRDVPNVSLAELYKAKAFLAAPITTYEKPLGVLLAYAPRAPVFADSDLELIQLLADQAAVILEHRALLEEAAQERARLHERAREAAILEERQRLARDLHDSVTQALYGISLYAEAAARALADGETEPVATNLRDVRETTQEALGEMRLLIYELRPPLLEEYGLAAALRARLKAVETRVGLVTDFESDGQERLAPEIEQELYRLAQEALNNVLKHAQAQRVRVRLAIATDRTTLEVADDGVGFEPSLQGAEGFGLPGMRERAERLGGTLQVESSPGAGTCLRVEISR